MGDGTVLVELNVAAVGVLVKDVSSGVGFVSDASVSFKLMDELGVVILVKSDDATVGVGPIDVLVGFVSLSVDSLRIEIVVLELNLVVVGASVAGLSVDAVSISETSVAVETLDEGCVVKTGVGSGVKFVDVSVDDELVSFE